MSDAQFQKIVPWLLLNREVSAFWSILLPKTPTTTTVRMHYGSTRRCQCASTYCGQLILPSCCRAAAARGLTGAIEPCRYKSAVSARPT